MPTLTVTPTKNVPYGIFILVLVILFAAILYFVGAEINPGVFLECSCSVCLVTPFFNIIGLEEISLIFTLFLSIRVNIYYGISMVDFKL